MNHASHLFLLGPQPNHASLRAVLERVRPHSPLGLITAGWEAEEAKDESIRTAAGVPVTNLALFARTEKLFADDPELIRQLQVRQDELRHLRDAYNDRLHLLLKAARLTIRRKESLVEFSAERESAIDMVRQLDQELLQRTHQVHVAFEEKLQIAQRPFVRKHVDELRQITEGIGGLMIAGGHVAIILNRLQIFGILDLLPNVPIIAWSGGTMALSRQIVFFHDSPPQGPGDAEVLRAGMNLLDSILPLPDAHSRLHLTDQARVALFARRFAEFRCVVLDENIVLERSDNAWQSVGSEPALCLDASGMVKEFAS